MQNGAPGPGRRHLVAEIEGAMPARLAVRQPPGRRKQVRAVDPQPAVGLGAMDAAQPHLVAGDRDLDRNRQRAAKFGIVVHVFEAVGAVGQRSDAGTALFVWRITAIVENGAEETFWKTGRKTICTAIHVAVAAITL